MVDDARAQKWEQDARNTLARSYGTGEPAAHLASVVLALLSDRDSLIRYAERISQTNGAERFCELSPRD